MQGNTQDFRWTEVSSRAAQLVAEGNLTYQEIADSLEIDNATLWRWRQADGFKARVDEHLEEIRAEIRRIGIADALKRVAHLNDVSNRMKRVIQARAASAEMAEVPGGTTGLMVRTVKSIGGGEHAQLVYEYSVDTPLLKELRDTHKQAAQELGQWAEKQQISGPDGGPLVVMKLGGVASMDDI